MTSDPKLLNWYTKYRRKYFNNALPLPSEMEIVFDKMPLRLHGCCEEDEAGEDTVIRINLAWSYFDDIACSVLLHEMNHLAVAPHWGHGKPFQDGMLRLAQSGAFKDLW